MKASQPLSISAFRSSPNGEVQHMLFAVVPADEEQVDWWLHNFAGSDGVPAVKSFEVRCRNRGDVGELVVTELREKLGEGWEVTDQLTVAGI